MGRTLRVLLAVSWILFVTIPIRADAQVDFNRNILPILSNNCFACHGPDANARKAGLRLDTPDGIVAQRKSGLPVNRERPQDSLLLMRVSATDDDRMPPPEEGNALSATEIELLQQWIEEGATWPEHWAFIAPENIALPDVQQTQWVRNPIDRFVLARLEAEGIHPAPIADRLTLLRRVSLDLVGLPPTQEEIATFLNDTAPGAYERLVDRLLASPRYGEHHARTWLDIARYADSQGFEKDRPRTMWRYRDWVINAMNADMPFDQFTREQMAGDLLDQPTLDQLIATGFHRNTQTNTEGGTDNEEFRSAAVIDRVNTTMQAWMGLTAGCAQCHTHKFDPISHEEYFGLYAFFNQTADADLDDDAPFIQAPTSTQHTELKQLNDAIGILNARLTPPDPEVQAAVTEWVNTQKPETPWSLLEPKTLNSESGALLTVDEEGVVVVTGPVPPTDTYQIQVHTNLPRITAIRLEAIEGTDGRGPGRTTHGNFVVNEIEVQSTQPESIPVTFADAEATFEQVEFPVSNAIDGDASTLSGWAIHPIYDKDQAAVFRFLKPLEQSDGTGLQITIRQTHGTQHVLERFRLCATDDPDAALHLPDSIQSVLATPQQQRDAHQHEVLARHVLKHTPTLKTLRDDLETAQTNRDTYLKNVPNALVMRDLAPDMQRTTHLFLGGSFMNPDLERGPIVPIVPAFLHPLPEHVQPDRLGLADWLVDEENPLTARVQVNRTWEQLFGLGLVETTNDFGIQGSRPSNQELLDWLARHWQHDLKWSHKDLLRLLVTSATYRQSARFTSSLLDRDPRNQLMARSPRLRLSAEQLRDQALAVSGLLQTNRIGGPSVTPWLPDGMLPQAFDTYVQPVSQGADLHRRSLYTDWRRTGHYPAFATFDAPSREYCTITRERSNTPLQALVLLNDRIFIEAAQALARRSMLQGGDHAQQRIAFAFEMALARPVTPDELSVLEDVYQSAYQQFQTDPEAAQSLATDPLGPLPEDMNTQEVAAMTTVSNVILNLDEFVTRP